MGRFIRVRSAVRRLLALNGQPHPDYAEDHRQIADLRRVGTHLARQRRRLGPAPLDRVMFPRDPGADR